MSSPQGVQSLSSDPATQSKDAVQVNLNRFLASVEKRALRMADMAVRNPDDALDIVQDSMLTLATKYAQKPADEWPPLFFRILQNKIRDFHRRGSVSRRIFDFFKGAGDDERTDAQDPVAVAPGPEHMEPAQEHRLDVATDVLDAALAELPNRQREAFLLRNWEGLDVAQTAQAMGCTQGSVKTHYSRAVHRLREQLDEHWHDK